MIPIKLPNWVRTKVLLLILGLMSIVCAITYVVAHTCNQMNRVPNVEIYPMSELGEQIPRELGGNRLRTTTYYTVPASTEAVIRFFSHKLDCNISDDYKRATCRGELVDSKGEYFVYIRQSNATYIDETTYAIE